MKLKPTYFLFILIHTTSLNASAQVPVFSAELDFKGGKKNTYSFETNEGFGLYVTSKKQLNIYLFDEEDHLLKSSNYPFDERSKDYNLFLGSLGNQSESGRELIYLNKTLDGLNKVEIQGDQIEFTDLPGVFKDQTYLCHSNLDRQIMVYTVTAYTDTLHVHILNYGSIRTVKFKLSDIPFFYDLIKSGNLIESLYSMCTERSKKHVENGMLVTKATTKFYPVDYERVILTLDEHDGISRTWEKKLKTETGVATGISYEYFVAHSEKAAVGTYIIELNLSTGDHQVESYLENQVKKEKMKSTSFLHDSVLYQLFYYKKKMMMHITGTTIADKRQVISEWCSEGNQNFFTDIPIQKAIMSSFSDKRFKVDEKNYSLFNIYGTSTAKKFPAIVANTEEDKVVLSYGVVQKRPPNYLLSYMSSFVNIPLLSSGGFTLYFNPVDLVYSMSRGTHVISAFAKVELNSDFTRSKNTDLFPFPESEKKIALDEKIEKINEKLFEEQATRVFEVNDQFYYAYYLPESELFEIVKFDLAF